MKKIEMKVLDANIRINNFNEVALGYSHEEAKNEASRCLNCPNPRCVKGCPVGIEIPKFIEAIKNDNIELAYEIIRNSTNLPAICGRVCPQEKQCEAMCIKGFKGDAISIGSLERYVADNAKSSEKVEIIPNGKSVAIVGSGPSGLSCAGVLAKKGYKVTIYEALHKAGGVLTYGIPEFRLPNNIVEKEINNLKKLGVEIILNAVVGSTITIDELKNKYDAIYIASGAGLPKFMGIENEIANEVFSANEILTRINLMKAYEKNAKTPIKEGNIVFVVGGGNVAMDAARSLRRFGMEVHLIYRRSMNELPARLAEVEHALEEGIIFDILKNPKKIVVDDDMHVLGMEVVDMELINDENCSRKNVKEKINSNQFMKCDMVVMALGTNPNPLAISNSAIKKDDKSLIIVDGSKTSEEGIFAGGDAVTGSATVILAMEAGKKAALEIDEYLS